MFTEVDVGHALVNLDRDLGIDSTALATITLRLEEGFAEALAEEEDDTVWSAGTRRMIFELMGFDPPTEAERSDSFGTDADTGGADAGTGSPESWVPDGSGSDPERRCQVMMFAADPVEPPPGGPDTPPQDIFERVLGASAFDAFTASSDCCDCWVNCCNGVCCDNSRCCWPSEGGGCPPCPDRCGTWIECNGVCCHPDGSCCNGNCCNGPCCSGSCCAAGSSCCNGSCCAETCCNGICCAEGESCCNGTCCAAGSSCCNGSCCAGPCCDGICCAEGSTCVNGVCCEGVECGGACCAIGETCCNGACCAGLCCNATCCAAGSSCCGSSCCGAGTTCCNPNTGLCCLGAAGRASGAAALGTAASLVAQECCIDVCCAVGFVCCGGTACCPVDQCCADGVCCNFPCNECVNNGSLSGGSIAVSAKSVCIGDTITFTVSGVTDSGGTKRVDCVEVSIPAVTPVFAWTLTVPPDYPPPLPPLSGAGTSVSVTAKVPGTYSAAFTASANRDCPPPDITIGPETGTAATTATLTLDPSSIPAKTAWAGAAWDFSDITVTWNPPGCEGTLEIVEVVGDDGYTPPNQGTLAPIDATKWRYTAFDEPPMEKHPKRVVVWIAAMQETQELTRVQLVVRTAFKWWVSGHRHGPGATMHSPTESDYKNAVDFILWKYASCFPPGGAFAGVSIASTATVSCQIGFNTWVDAAACTNSDNEVTFGTSTFTRGENIAASVIGHELFHTVGANECEALTWELDNSNCTSIDATYLHQTLLDKIAVCGQL